MKNLDEALSTRKHKQDFTPPDENIVFTIDGKNIGCLQSFVCFQGLPKAGKSTFITSAVASAFTTWDIFSMKINTPPGRKRVCYIDTESSEFDYYRVINRIKEQIICDKLPGDFDSFNFREDSAQEIQKLIDHYLSKNLDCSVLVIDGILDLISDFNSVEQSFFLVQWLKKITKVYNLLILCVLHLGKKDQNSIGHIGSYLDRKAQSVLKIDRNKENKTIDLSATFLRSCDDFTPISIYNSGNTWHQQNNEKVNSGTYIFGMEKTSLINRILFEPRKYIDFLNELSEFTGKGQTTCKKLIKDWIIDGSIIKNNELYKQK